MLSGSKSNLAVKIFGPELGTLRSLAAQVEAVLAGVPGIVDLSNQEQAAVPQLVFELDRAALARHSLPAAEARATWRRYYRAAAAELVETRVARVVPALPRAAARRSHKLGELTRRRRAAPSAALRGAQRASTRPGNGTAGERRARGAAVGQRGGRDPRTSTASARRSRRRSSCRPATACVRRAVRERSLDSNLAAFGIVLVATGGCLVAFAATAQRRRLVNMPLVVVGGVGRSRFERHDPVELIVGFVTLFASPRDNGC